MTEAATTYPGTKPAPGLSFLELPNFEVPTFALPSLEVPAGFREAAEKGVAQATDVYEKTKAAAEETTAVIESTYTRLVKGSVEYQRGVIEAARANTNATLDYARDLIRASSPSQILELSAAHAHSRCAMLGAQAQELAALAHKVATEAAEPIKAGVTKSFKLA
jgi:phasin